MYDQKVVNINPLAKFEANTNKYYGFDQFYLGEKEYINTGEYNNHYVVNKSCINPLVTKGQLIPEVLYHACQTGIQYMNEKFYGIFDIKNTTAVALHNGDEVHKYALKDLNGTKYLYQDGDFKRCLVNLEKLLKNYQHNNGRDIQNYTEESIWSAINSIHDLKEITYPYNDESFIQQFFQLRDCDVFKVEDYAQELSNNITSTVNSAIIQSYEVSSPAQLNTTLQSWLNNSIDVVNTTISTILNATLETIHDQENEKEEYSTGTIIACGVGLLTAVGLVEYASYRMYKYYRGENTCQTMIVQTSNQEVFDEETPIIGDTEL